MESRVEKTIERHNKGYNCAQAIVLAFHEEAGLDREQALRLASSFGGGMGRLREVCGAVSGMFMVAGYLYGTTDKDGEAEKGRHAAGRLFACGAGGL